MTPDPVLIGSYPRDDVWSRWLDDGRTRNGHATVRVVGDDGSLTELGVARLADTEVVRADVPVGGSLVVDLEAEHAGQHFRRRVTFTATGDEDDVYV
ncbi:MAG TPA: hypothetical protein VN088_19030, partial [Nocardioides sp.]|nr:hypothetical protein [Nocardioides sp.]